MIAHSISFISPLKRSTDSCKCCKRYRRISSTGFTHIHDARSEQKQWHWLRRHARCKACQSGNYLYLLNPHQPVLKNRQCVESQLKATSVYSMTSMEPEPG